jgi:DNA-binding NarL/FixJ family response regulator
MAFKVVVIEDEAVFRQMLGMALRRIRGLIVSGEFADGRAGLDYCLARRPNLLIVDLYLPGMHGLEVVQAARAKLPEMRILVLTGHPDGDLPAQLIAQGVHGFVDKSEPINYILQAVESVMSGGMYFATNVAPTAVRGDERAATVKAVPGGLRPTAPATSLQAVEMLSSRELEVARLVAEGFSSKEVASRLGLSARTVEKHRANIMDKIGVREVASLVRWCVQSGLVHG